ncbi:CHAT domain-containing protein [Nocardia tengchongensis]|uniref:CHAT domain-containing protein n=1 Tax=Nocardia tengchongensis TaxID=2055889 RepID=UPI00360E28F1
MVSTIRLEIEAGLGDGEFTTRVVDSPVGVAFSASMHLDAAPLLGQRNDLEMAVLASAVTGRGISDLNEEKLRAVGAALFDALLTDKVLDAFRASIVAAQGKGEPLRVELRMSAPGLAALPWEALWDKDTQGYVCLTESMVRHVSAPYIVEPQAVTSPLRVLGLVASPRGMPPLNVSAEQEGLENALNALTSGGWLELEWLTQASWDAVHEKLLSDQWHVVHFIGHGDFDVASNQGSIALIGAGGRADMVAANKLAILLRQAEPMPRLVVLNSCASGEQSATDLFSGTAAVLVHHGINAVAAMQFTISDPAAISFARGFYTAIAHGHNVDDAVRSGRIAILGGASRTLEWVTPVLYLRSGNTQLFTLTPKPLQPSETNPTRVHDLARLIAALWRRHARIIGMGIVLVLATIVVAFCVAKLVGDHDSALALPPGAHSCPQKYDEKNGYAHSAYAGSHTSCEFAEEVRIAYAEGRRFQERTIDVYSPITGQNYQMSRIPEGEFVRCTNTSNAVVYIY